MIEYQSICEMISEDHQPPYGTTCTPLVTCYEWDLYAAAQAGWRTKRTFFIVGTTQAKVTGGGGGEFSAKLIDH